MYLVWFALFLMSASWWFLTPILLPSQWEGYLLLFVGLISFIIGLNKRVKISFNKGSYLLFIPLLISSVLFSFPFNCGFLILIVALFFTLFKNNISISTITSSIIIFGILLIFQALFFALYYWLAPQFHNLQLFSPFLNFLINLMGFSSYWHDNNLFIETARGVINFTTTVEKSGLDFALLLLFGAVALISIFNTRKRWNKIIILIFITFLYLVIRYLFFIIIYLSSDQLNIFWNRWIVILSFLPLILLYIKFIKLGDTVSIPFKIFYSKKQILTGIILFLGSSLILFGLLFHDPGSKKQGRILIDEKHSDWEWTTQKFDTTWYGEKSSYNYYCLFNYISHYYKTERNFESISSKILNKYDILIIKTPTRPYALNEVKSIVTFVENGGSLFLIGDHTNVFGTSSYLNPIAGKFGIKLNYDATFDLSSGKLTFFKPTKFLMHPVAQNLDFLLFGTSCSLETDLSAEQVITGYGLKSINLDYSKKNFFADVAESSEMNFGLFTQMAAAKTGKGRVLVFTDSTIFSNFWMFMSGKPELFLGSLNWLNRQNYLMYLKFILILLGSGLCVLFFILQFKYHKRSQLFVLLLFGSLGVSTGVLLGYVLNKKNYELPKPHTKFVSIAFDMEHSKAELPDKELNENPNASYSTFYVWTQRVNLIPKTTYTFDNAINNNDIVCIINPYKSFSKKQLQNIFSFVSKGGKLLIMDDLMNSESTSNQLLQLFSMSFEKQIWNQNFEFDTLKNMTKFSLPNFIINGGKPFIYNDIGQSIACVMQIGKGKVIAFSASSLFCDANMGYTNAFPNKNQLKIFKLEYRLINELSNK